MNKHFINDIGIWAEDDRFIKEVIIGEEYKYLFDYDVVVDVGSNIGTFAIWIYPYTKRIYAIEPNPHAVKLLAQTVADNNLTKVSIHEVALTGSDGNRHLANIDDLAYGSGLINDKTGIIVECTQMDTFMVKHQIEFVDLLKIDIEGLEQEVFESAGFRNASKKIGTIIGEYHNGEVQEKVRDLLTGMDFRYIDLTKANSSGKFIARHI